MKDTLEHVGRIVTEAESILFICRMMTIDLFNSGGKVTNKVSAFSQLVKPLSADMLLPQFGCYASCCGRILLTNAYFLMLYLWGCFISV